MDEILIKKIVRVLLNTNKMVEIFFNIYVPFAIFFWYILYTQNGLGVIPHIAGQT